MQASVAEPRARKPKQLKRVFTVLALAPLGYLGLQAATNGLGANPIATVLNFLGFWTLVLLLASLVPTPLKILLGWTWPLQVRKLLGLAAFFYAAAHFLVYLAVDQGFDVGEIGADIVKRKFITIGFAAFVLLIPLAVTSRSSMVKRLGFARWKRLHRTVYLVAALGVIHFLWRVKADHRQPLLFGTALVVLLLVRVVDAVRRRGVVAGSTR